MTRTDIRDDRGSASVGLVLLVVIVIAGSGLIFDGARYIGNDEKKNPIDAKGTRRQSSRGSHPTSAPGKAASSP